MEADRERYDTVRANEHVFELTLWMRNTSYHAHFRDLPTNEFEPVYALPDAEKEPQQREVCDGVARVLRKAMDVLDHDDATHRQLSKTNAKLLNTWKGNEMKTRPMKRLQNVDGGH